VVKSILRRSASAVLVLLTISFLTFGAMNVLGDPVTNILGVVAADTDDPASQALVADVERQYHLDDPLPVRWARWAGDFATGDFGVQFSEDGQPPVRDLVADRLPHTVLLLVMAQVLALALALPWSLWAAPRAGTVADGASTVAVFVCIAIPDFALAVLLKYALTVQVELLPPLYRPDDPLLSRMGQLFLPALALALPSAAVYQRLLRSDLVETLRADFVATALAKGISRRRVMLRHVLRPSLTSLITVFGLTTGALLGGTLVVEQVFLVPGLGRAMVEAILREDFPVVLAIVMIVAATFVVVNLVVDVLYTVIDPRVAR
jgi:peptide/nickel transport system permease protein